MAHGVEMRIEMKVHLHKLWWVCALSYLIVISTDQTAKAASWREIEPGMAMASFQACFELTSGQTPITIVKINPELFRFRLLHPADHGEGTIKTIQEMADQQHLALATNAGMFAEQVTTQDGQTHSIYKHVGFVKYLGKVENGKRLTDYKSVFAFHPLKENLPAATLADLEETTLAKLGESYDSLIQNLRMIGHRRRNVWSQSPRRHSIAALATNQTGELLFVFSGAPYSVHDFNRCLLSLPLKITRAQYLEGGKEATLILRTPTLKLNLIGSSETLFGSDTESKQPWPIPFILGLERRPPAKPTQ